jgi:alkylhydroperoxidase family enzyme
VISLISKEDGLRIAKEHGIDQFVAGIDGFRPVMHSPTAANAVANLLLALMTRNTLSARTRELVILRIGWRSGSEYEFCNHVRVSRSLKMSDEEILGVRDPDPCPAFSEADRAVIKMADELLDGTEVSGATQTVLTSSFSDAERVELLITAGFWRMMACWLNTVKVPLEPEVPGWPEGKAPLLK